MRRARRGGGDASWPPRAIEGSAGGILRYVGIARFEMVDGLGVGRKASELKRVERMRGHFCQRAFQESVPVVLSGRAFATQPQPWCFPGFRHRKAPARHQEVLLGHGLRVPQERCRRSWQGRWGAQQWRSPGTIWCGRGDRPFQQCLTGTGIESGGPPGKRPQTRRVAPEGQCTRNSAQAE
eukprot:11178589-Lingulodinium_polyedra.AAC.1